VGTFGQQWKKSPSLRPDFQVFNWLAIPTRPSRNLELSNPHSAIHNLQFTMIGPVHRFPSTPVTALHGPG
jgi:hypothetical protein